MRRTAGVAALVIALAGTALPAQGAVSPPRAAGSAVDGRAESQAYTRAESRAAEPTVPAPYSWAVGWSAVVTSSPRPGIEQLALISPSGGRRAVATVPAGTEVIDVRHDARAVITRAPRGQDDPSVFTVWDVVTGRRFRVQLPPASRLFFGPDSRLISAEGYPTSRVRVRAWGGAPQRDLSVPASDQAVVSPGGSTYIVPRGNDIAVHDVATNRTVRVIPNQPPSVECRPHGLWSDGATRFGCYDIPGNSRTYKALTSTGAVTPLVREVPDAGEAFATTPVSAQTTWSSSCDGPGNGVAIVQNGQPRWLAPNGPWGSSTVFLDAIAGSRTSLWMTVGWSCRTDEQRRSLVRYDTTAGTTTVLAGPGSPGSQGAVRSAATIDGLT
ncbi:hypothetical protein PZ938_13455 [Luteipulveratus sp. YIM 133132]|uniref:hypothetical protein n=1 Tax=Luteipulveratus flavus TaxID=3031728 RepID=UPI0023AFC03E|nr:hypothetical protein [Luteipulveratus sp. YIM 133132]MDE9366614.1 hypothetical protein [Luteipulveratus sp. YIM 133132]